jgi:hypothetical protein
MKMNNRKQGLFIGFAVLLMAAIFTLAGCDNGTNGGGGGTGGDITWDEWEEASLNEGHTAGWPSSQISSYGITLSSPGGAPYWWDESGDLVIEIGRATQAMFGTLKNAIDEAANWTADDKNSQGGQGGYYYWTHDVSGAEIRLVSHSSTAGGIVISIGFTPGD